MTTLNDRSTALSLLLTRRSGKPATLTHPGPSAMELETILKAGARVPDHGKLGPWRFVIIPAAEREAFRDLLLAAYDAEVTDPSHKDREKLADFAVSAPALVVVLSQPILGHKIPVWEQELSAGAACQTMLIAAHTLGYVGSWLTGFAAYSPRVYAALGGTGGGRVAGYLFFGTPVHPIEERPRPALEQIAHVWTAPATLAPA